MNEEIKDKKFFYPDLLYIVQQLSRYEDFVDKICDHLAKLLDCENEDNEIYSNLVEIILEQMFEKMLDFKSDLNDMREDFPSMSIFEWEKLREKWVKFIDGIDDLELNE